MKILHVISSVNPVGGGPIEAMNQLGLRMAEVGHRAEVLSLDPPGAPYLKECSLPVHPLGPATLHYAFSSRFVPWLRTNRSQYDAVVVHGIWQYHSFGTWRALRKFTTPYVLFPHGALSPWFKKQYPLKHLKKWMYWPWAEYRVLRDAQAVLFTCEGERAQASSSFWMYRCKEMVVNLGTARPKGDPELDVEQFFGYYPALRGKKLVLFMGRIHPIKGCDLVIEAFAKVLRPHPEWHLVIAGPDQEGLQKGLNHRALQLGLGSRVTWTGMVGGAKKWGALRAAEVFLLPSHHENFSIVAAEALAIGLPTLISNQVNIWREILSDGAGIVSEDTLEGTCSLLKSYLEMSAEKKLVMRRAARDCFDRRFNITRAAERLCAILGNVSRVN